jgi:hypothetical protein
LRCCFPTVASVSWRVTHSAVRWAVVPSHMTWRRPC